MRDCPSFFFVRCLLGYFFHWWNRFDLSEGLLEDLGFGGYYGRGGGYRGGMGQQHDSDDESDDSEGSKENNSEQDEEEAKRSLAEEIKRKYFPEHFPWTPFGDPFESRKKR